MKMNELLNSRRVRDILEEIKSFDKAKTSLEGLTWTALPDSLSAELSNIRRDLSDKLIYYLILVSEEDHDETLIDLKQVINEESS